VKTWRLGVFGGTFDPIHSGHLIAAASVRNALELDLVIFVPTGHSWHKLPGPLAPAMDRLAMVDLALADYEGFISSSVDIDRLGPTYTIDTLTELQAQWHNENVDDEATWFFITGADALTEFTTWKEPEEILKRAQLVGVTRPGFTASSGPLLTGHSIVIEASTPDIASSDIRLRMREGRSIEGLLPTVVADYIQTHSLYLETPVGL
jgi:nicotinate-nucleotide adenylyltransferase